jgi:hypothetical protein
VHGRQGRRERPGPCQKGKGREGKERKPGNRLRDREGKKGKNCGGTRFLLITFDLLFSGKEMVEGSL